VVSSRTASFGDFVAVGAVISLPEVIVVLRGVMLTLPEMVLALFRLRVLSRLLLL